MHRPEIRPRPGSRSLLYPALLPTPTATRLPRTGMIDAEYDGLEMLEPIAQPWRSRPGGFAQVGELFVRANARLCPGGSEAHSWFCEPRRCTARPRASSRGSCRERFSQRDRGPLLRHGSDTTLAPLRWRCPRLGVAP